MDQHLNYLGAAIFWLYIVAALFFTGLVIYTIVSCIHQNDGCLMRQHKRDIAIFSTLACISFVTLSYNMLRVLIDSFLYWYQQQSTSKTLGIHSIIQWSLESTLFQDFAQGLVQTQPRLYWTQASLLATLSVCLFMGTEGYRKQVPRLGAFFCLSQILPISFTQNLFYITILSLPDPSAELRVPRRPIIIAIIIYAASLLSVNKGTKGVLPIIIAARVTLLTPLILYHPSWANSMDAGGGTNGLDIKQLLPYLTIYYIATAVMTFRREELSVQDVGNALFDHPAVSSLGCDFILSAISCVAWWLTTRWRRSPETQVDARVE